MHINNQFTINEPFDINMLNLECARVIPISLHPAKKKNYLSDLSLHKDVELILNTFLMCWRSQS